MGNNTRSVFVLTFYNATLHTTFEYLQFLHLAHYETGMVVDAPDFEESST